MAWNKKLSKIRIKPNRSYTIKEVSVILDRHKVVIYNYLKAGKLKGTKTKKGNWEITGKDLIECRNKIRDKQQQGQLIKTYPEVLMRRVLQRHKGYIGRSMRALGLKYFQFHKLINTYGIKISSYKGSNRKSRKKNNDIIKD